MNEEAYATPTQSYVAEASKAPSPEQAHRERIEQIFNAALLGHSPQIRKSRPLKPGERAALPWKTYGGNVSEGASDEQLKTFAVAMATMLEDHLFGRKGTPSDLQPEYRKGLMFISQRIVNGIPIVFEILANHHDAFNGSTYFLGAQFSKEMEG